MSGLKVILSDLMTHKMISILCHILLVCWHATPINTESINVDNNKYQMIFIPVHKSDNNNADIKLSFTNKYGYTKSEIHDYSQNKMSVDGFDIRLFAPINSIKHVTYKLSIINPNDGLIIHQKFLSILFIIVNNINTISDINNVILYIYGNNVGQTIKYDVLRMNHMEWESLINARYVLPFMKRNGFINTGNDDDHAIFIPKKVEVAGHENVYQFGKLKTFIIRVINALSNKLFDEKTQGFDMYSVRDFDLAYNYGCLLKNIFFLKAVSAKFVGVKYSKENIPRIVTKTLMHGTLGLNVRITNICLDNHACFMRDYIILQNEYDFISLATSIKWDNFSEYNDWMNKIIDRLKYHGFIHKNYGILREMRHMDIHHKQYELRKLCMWYTKYVELSENLLREIRRGFEMNNILDLMERFHGDIVNDLEAYLIYDGRIALSNTINEVVWRKCNELIGNTFVNHGNINKRLLCSWFNDIIADQHVNRNELFMKKLIHIWTGTDYVDKLEIEYQLRLCMTDISGNTDTNTLYLPYWEGMDEMQWKNNLLVTVEGVLDIIRHDVILTDETYQSHFIKISTQNARIILQFIGKNYSCSSVGLTPEYKTIINGNEVILFGPIFTRHAVWKCKKSYTDTIITLEIIMIGGNMLDSVDDVQGIIPNIRYHDMGYLTEMDSILIQDSNQWNGLSNIQNIIQLMRHTGMLNKGYTMSDRIRIPNKIRFNAEVTVDQGGPIKEFIRILLETVSNELFERDGKFKITAINNIELGYVYGRILGIAFILKSYHGTFEDVKYCQHNIPPIILKRILFENTFHLNFYSNDETFLDQYRDLSVQYGFKSFINSIKWDDSEYIISSIETFIDCLKEYGYWEAKYETTILFNHSIEEIKRLPQFYQKLILKDIALLYTRHIELNEDLLNAIKKGFQFSHVPSLLPLINKNPDTILMEVLDYMTYQQKIMELLYEAVSNNCNNLNGSSQDVIHSKLVCQWFMTIMMDKLAANDEIFGKKLINLWTGADYVDIDKIYIDYKSSFNGKPRLIEFHTCTNTIDLPYWDGMKKADWIDRVINTIQEASLSYQNL